jgi:hypothetical protein
MRNLNTKWFIWILLSISLLVWIALACIQSIRSPDLPGLLRLFPTVVAIDCAVVGLFVKWLWKWRLLHPWLVPFPDLSGAWTGEIRSSYNDTTSTETPAPIPATLCVRQTFVQISCVMETAEMRSASALCTFDLDPDRQQRQLGYIYCSRPKLGLAEKSAMHDGAAIFDILDEPATKLSGQYWTTRGTRGDIELRRNRKRR